MSTACGGQKRFSDPLKLELLVVLNCLMGVLETEFGSCKSNKCS